MTDREFAMEVLAFVRASVDSDECYTLSEKGRNHFELLCARSEEGECSEEKDLIMSGVYDVELFIRNIKRIAYGTHTIDGKKCSDAEVDGIIKKRLFDGLAKIEKAMSNQWDDDEGEE